ncbi:SIMPL domain-containing protein [Methanolobus zinderi]|uniref:SIMPL domain-containing protein n=1 Tax=Methanolobus zinderi TaxID=536044 RepID=A0A7D5EFB4_9EURY|nr:SIMPL domain-containing protein [Methanolobus zinderi]QLC50596.1 SIMPL domain-containing protein [Methanolobus zinderi]
MSQENKNDKTYLAIIALSIVLVVMSLTIYAIAQGGSEQNSADTITMNGYAEQKVVPDTASLSIGVVIESETAKEATDKNAAIMSAVMEELKSIGLEDREIRTSSVSVYPVYNYEGERRITGYSASNSVQVTTTDLDSLSEIIDRSTAAGANQIGSISFSASDDMQEELREDLMNEAIADASSKAGELADSLGVEITGVQTASVNEGGNSPVYYAADREAVPMEDGAASTPIEPGESTVSMSVQVTYYIG